MSVPNLDATQFSVLLRHTYTALLWADGSGCIVWANSAAEQLLAKSVNKLQGMPLTDLFAPIVSTPAHTAVPPSPPPTKLPAQLQQATQYQQPFTNHDHYLTSVSQPVCVDYSVTPCQLEQHSGFIVEMWPQGRHQRINHAQQQQSHHAVARHMLRAVAHEVKNPLAGIRGAAQLLLKQQQLIAAHATASPKAMQYAQIIMDESDRLTGLIGQLLGNNRPPRWQWVNIHQPLEHVLTLAHTRFTSLCIQRDYDTSLPDLWADPDQLIQLLLNLVNNAIDALSEAGTDVPTLTLRTRVAYQHTIGSTLHKQVLSLSMADNGPGIDPELLEQMFFPLVSGRAQGTGLGLSIAQDLVHQHGGSIEVTSKPQHTEFVMYLPWRRPD